MFPQDPEWGRDPKINILDIYFGTDGDNVSTPISGQHVDVSLDGTFSQSAAQAANAGSQKEWWLTWLSNVITSGADMAQRFMDSTVTGKYCRRQSYSISEIEAMSKQIENGQKIEESENDDDVLDEKVIKVLNIQKTVNTDDQENSQQDISGTENNENIVRTIDLAKTIENKKGITTTVFTSETEIPVIQADIYSMAKGTFDLFDVNFFNEKEEEFGNKETWDFIRSNVVICSRACLYISTVLLLTLLIYRGITFILHIYERKSRFCKYVKRSN